MLNCVVSGRGAPGAVAMLLLYFTGISGSVMKNTMLFKKKITKLRIKI